LRQGDAALIKDGIIEVAKHQTRDIALVPVAGRYPVKCSHFLHKGFGMTGQIVVD